MPTTPNGVSKFLANRGFQRAAWIGQINGPGFWSGGFHIEEVEDQIVIWAYAERPSTMLVEISAALMEGGYEFHWDTVTRVIKVYDRDPSEGMLALSN